MLTLRIALRYLRSKKSHAAVNVISVISLAGMAVATAAIVVVLSVFNGFADLQESHMSVLDPDARIETASGAFLPDADSLLAVAKRTPGVHAAAIVVEGRALATLGDLQLPVRYKGVGPEYAGVCRLDEAIVDGRAQLGVDQMGAVASAGIATRLMSGPNAERGMVLSAPRRVGRLNPGNMAASMRTDTVAVSGVMQVGLPEVDNDLLLVPLSTARTLLDYDCEATAIELSADPAAVDALQRALGDGYCVKTRAQIHETAFKMVAVEKWVTFAMLVFILVIASFNIISTLSMMVVEKRDNMSTLRALGASGKMIRRVFVWLGWLVSVGGGLVGMILGVGLALAQQYGGFIKLNGDPSTLIIDYYPVRVDPADLLVVAAVVVLIGLLTSAITASFATADKDKH